MPWEIQKEKLPLYGNRSLFICIFPFDLDAPRNYYLPVTVHAPLLLFSELVKMLSRVAMKALCQQQQGRVVVSLVRPCSSAVAAPGQRDLVNYPRR